MLRDLFRKLFGGASRPKGPDEALTPSASHARRETDAGPPSPIDASTSAARSDAAGPTDTPAPVPQWSRPARLPIDLDIGFDLGTSCTKVVIGDKEANKQTAVPVNGGLGLAGYLLPSRVYFADGVYSLDPTVGCVTKRDLKMRIMQSAQHGEAVAHEALCDLAAFAALVIRRVLRWYPRELAASHPNREPVWHLNVGLSSKGGADDSFAEIYGRLMRMAACLGQRFSALRDPRGTRAH